MNLLKRAESCLRSSFTKALYGDISQLSIWDSELSPSEVAELAECRTLDRGSVFNLNTASVEVVGDVSESLVDSEVFCR